MAGATGFDPLEQQCWPPRLGAHCRAEEGERAAVYAMPGESHPGHRGLLPVGSEVAGEEPGGKTYKDPQRICDFTMTQR